MQKKWKWSSHSHVQLFVTPLTVTQQASLFKNALSKNAGVGTPSFFQGFLLTQGQTQVSHIAGKFFTIWDTKEIYSKYKEKVQLRTLYKWMLLKHMDLSLENVTPHICSCQ